MYGFSSFSEAPFSSLAINEYQLSAESGAYSITGGNATFTLNQAIKGGAGSYTLTGSSATFVYNQVIYGGTWNYQISGKAAQLARSRIFAVETGSYTLIGNDASLETVVSLQAEAGAYVFTGLDADLEYTRIPVVIEAKGGFDTKRKTKAQREKEQREELEKLVKKEFDILDGTYVPEVIETVKEQVLPKIKEIDYTQYAIALAQVNALILQAKIQAAEYASELDDEEAIMLLL